MKLAVRMTQTLLLALLVLVLGVGSVLAADKKAPKNDFPNSTRKDPKVVVSESAQKKLNSAYDLIEKNQPDKAEALLNEVLASPKSSKYEQAAANIGMASVAYEHDQPEKAIEYNQKAVELDALDNRMHFDSLYRIAQLNLQEAHYDAALKAIDQWLTQTGSSKADAWALKANALYRLDKFGEAATAMDKAISLSDKPNDSWVQILMASYTEGNNFTEAAKVGESILAKDPNNKRIALQLASIYLEGKQDDKALATLEGAYKRGILTEDKELKQLYQTYNYVGRPKDAADVITTGLSKGVLQASYETYKALGDSYALQAEADKNDAAAAAKALDAALEAYGKAAPFAKDGETDYMRGQLLIQEKDNFAEGKKAIQAALAKGNFKHVGEAYILLGNAESQLGNDAAAITAYQKAATYPNTKKMADSWLKNMHAGAKPSKKK